MEKIRASNILGTHSILNHRNLCPADTFLQVTDDINKWDKYRGVVKCMTNLADGLLSLKSEIRTVRSWLVVRFPCGQLHKPGIRRWPRLAKSEEGRQSSRLRRSGRQIHTANRIEPLMSAGRATPLRRVDTV